MSDFQFLDDIPGWEGYSISEEGYVYNNKLHRFVSACLDDKGYYIIHLQRNRKQYHRRIHRLLALTFIPNPENLPNVDHKNRDQSDNNLSNLRWCSQDQNMKNSSKVRLTTSSKYKGVTWDKESSKWRARSILNGKRISIGRFTNELDAAIAYDEFVMVNHGEFANPNIIEM